MAWMRPLWLLFLFGAPGAGKSTLAARLAKRHCWRHINVGELLRRAALGNSSPVSPAQARELRELLATGDRIAPSAVTVKLLADELQLKAANLAIAPAGQVIIDGFPRNRENWETFEALMQQSKSVSLAYNFIWLELPFATALERARARGRSDDIDQVVAQRFTVYSRETLPLQKLLPTERLYVIPADRSPDEIETIAEHLLRDLGIDAERNSSPQQQVIYIDDRSKHDHPDATTA